MNMSQFGHERDLKSEFRLLHVQALYEFQTESSISFQLGRNGICQFCFYIFGGLDVHFHVDPDGHEKMYLRVFLPSKYQKEHQREKIVKRVFDVLEIPPGTAYEAWFVTAENGRLLGFNDPDVLYA